MWTCALTFSCGRHRAFGLLLRVALVCVTTELNWTIWKSVRALNITIVTTGFDDRQLVAGVPATEAGVHAAILDSMFLSDNGTISLSQVTLKYSSTQGCNAAEANFDVVSQFYYSKTWNDSLMVLITPGCGDSLHLAALAREWNLLMIATRAVYAETRDRKKYPTFISASALQTSVLVESIFSLMSYYRWTTISVIYDTATLSSYNELAPAMLQLVKSKYTNIILELYPIASTRKDSWSPMKLLSSIKTTSRVVILSMHPTNVRIFMLTASIMGLTSGEFAFITMEAVRSFNNGILTWQNDDEHDSTAFQAYRALLQIVVCPRNATGRTENFIDHLKDIAVNQHHLIYLPGDAQPNEVTIAAYQSVEMLKQVANEMVMDGSDVTDTKHLTKRFLNRSFDLSGGRVYIDSNGQRRNDVCVNDLNIDTGQFQAVLRYDAQRERTTLLPGQIFDWATADHQPPLNEPICGYLGNKEACTSSKSWVTTSATAATCSIAAFGLVFICALKAVRKGLLQQEWILDPTLLKIKKQGQPVTSKYLQAINDTHQLDAETDVVSMLRTEWNYKGEPVSVKLCIGSYNALHEAKRTRILTKLKKLDYTNIVRFVGVCVRKTDILLISEYCSRGNLDEFLTALRPSYFDLDLRKSLISDLVEGLAVIHGSFLKRHGNLSPSTCLVDSRFTLKISEAGYSELIVSQNSNTQASGQEADISALGSIIALLYKSDQNGEEGTTDVLMSRLIEECKSTNSLTNKNKPSVATVRHRFALIVGKRTGGILANILYRIQGYANELEISVGERTSALIREKQANENLLLEILPRVLIERLSSGYDVPAETFASCTILFCHIYNFIDFATMSPAFVVVQFLNNLFAVYDGITTLFHVYKVETIGDSYMVVSGVPVRNFDLHASEICTMAVRFAKGFELYADAATHSQDLKFIAGVHSGPCVAGVIGSKRPRYCLFGDTVNVASRMASHGQPTKIHVSVATVQLLQGNQEFSIRERGKTFLKGRGELLTFWLEEAR